MTKANHLTALPRKPRRSLKFRIGLLLSSHLVKKFFIDPSAGFLLCFYHLFQEFFHQSTSRFSFPVLVKVGRFFYQQYLHFMIFRFSSHTSSIRSWRFFIDWSFVRFFSPVFHHWVGRFFTSDMIVWDLSAFLQG